MEFLEAGHTNVDFLLVKLRTAPASVFALGALAIFPSSDFVLFLTDSALEAVRHFLCKVCHHSNFTIE